MDVRHEFDEILNNYGHVVLVVRKDVKERCSCYNEKNQSSDRDCPVCFGLGFNVKIEAHLTRDMDVSMRVEENAAMPTYGDLFTKNRFYYFRPEVKVAEKDLLIEVRFDGLVPIYEGGGVFEVQKIDPARFGRGELIFNKILVVDQPVAENIRGFRIAEKAGEISYEMIGVVKP